MSVASQVKVASSGTKVELRLLKCVTASIDAELAATAQLDPQLNISPMV